MEAYAPNLAGDAAAYRPHHFSDGYSVLKTHRYFDRRFERVIVLYRDPYDAIRSYYAMELMVNALRPAQSMSAEDS